MSELTYEGLMKVYREAESRIKEREEACKAECAADKALMAKIEAGLHQMLLRDERKNAKTMYGTAYLEQWRAPKMEDREAYWQWLKKKDRFDMLPATILKGPALEEWDNVGEIPGVVIETGIKLKVRKS
jgi:hypothetical protein